MAENRTIIYCSLCDFQCFDHDVLFKHVRFHENDPRFMVECSICGTSAKKWSTLRKHFQRCHKDQLKGNPPHELATQGTSQIEIDFNNHQESLPQPFTHIDPKCDEALFLLGTTHSMHLSYRSIEELCLSTQSFVETVCNRVKDKILLSLSPYNIPLEVMDQLQDDVADACTPEQLFDGLTNRATREKYYMTHFNYVEPTPVVMHKSWEWKNVHGKMTAKEVEYTGYIIDLIGGLKSLLSNPAVLEEVSLSHECSESGVMGDICDGEFIKNHTLFQKYKDALQFIIYYDDIEVCNPLGASAGVHKLGVFYYLLANIRPVFRSSLQSMQLLAVAKAEDIHTYGCESLLRPFVEDMKLLSKDEGYMLELSNDQTITLHGAVVCFCGDIPASNFVGGFKEGVGFSYRKCRQCFCSQDDIQTHFNIEKCSMREVKEHEKHCESVEEDYTGTAGYSATYGINRRSILMDLPFFDVTKCLPFDIMHTVFQGIVPMFLNHLLKHIIGRYLSLDELNNCFQNYQYGYSNMDTKPSIINGSAADYTIKQKASQMRTLIRFFPSIIGSYIPEDDEHWDCLLLLWDICSMVTQFQVTELDASNLEWTIQTFLESFVTLYPYASFKPKMHYLIHLPGDILRFGPLRNTWCMRFESKNKEIKTYVTSCYKNVPYSVSVRHQQSLCYLLAVKPRIISHFLYAGDEIISCKNVPLNDSSLGDHVKTICDLDEVPSYIPRAKAVIIYGVKYAEKAIIRVSLNNDYIYVQITAIYILNNIKMFVGRTMNIVQYDSHKRNFKVKPSTSQILSTFEDFYRHGVLHLHNNTIIEKDSVNVSL